MSSSVLQGHMMPESAVDTLLRERGVGVRSLARDGTPYGIPMSFGYADDSLYFPFVGHSDGGGRCGTPRRPTGRVSSSSTSPMSEGRSAVGSGPFERITPERWDDTRAAMADDAHRPDLLTDVDDRENPRVWVLDGATRTGRRLDGE